MNEFSGAEFDAGPPDWLKVTPSDRHPEGFEPDTWTRHPEAAAALSRLERDGFLPNIDPDTPVPYSLTPKGEVEAEEGNLTPKGERYLAIWDRVAPTLHQVEPDMWTRSPERTLEAGS